MDRHEIRNRLHKEIVELQEATGHAAAAIRERIEARLSELDDRIDARTGLWITCVGVGGFIAGIALCGIMS